MSDILLRPWHRRDAAALALIANDRNIWDNVRDQLPFPYTLADAVQWINHCHTQEPPVSFAIEYKVSVAGSIGCVPQQDVYRKNMEIGYFVGESFKGKGIATGAVRILAQQMNTDYGSAFGDSMIGMIGYDMAKSCAADLYKKAGLGPQDVQVVELHDCFTTNELLTYEAIGLCPEGGAEQFIWDGQNTYGGKYVTNPSGGLLSKGHPLGATGLAQCAELTWQLRGQADKRQVEGAKVALQHNLGLGGACVMTMYGRD